MCQFSEKCMIPVGNFSADKNDGYVGLNKLFNQSVCFCLSFSFFPCLSVCPPKPVGLLVIYVGALVIFLHFCLWLWRRRLAWINISARLVLHKAN